MASLVDPKQTHDYSEEVKARIPEIIEPAKQDRSRLGDAVEQLLLLEKKTRLAADAFSTSLIATNIVKLCAQCEDWKMLNDQIHVISKRRAQLKKPIQAAVEEAMTYLDATPDKATKLQLIDTLRTVCAGKIFVELERARLTRILAQIREEEGNIASASEVLQEVQVETVGSMEAPEKADFLLEQMRLCLDNQDYVRSEITSQKLNKKMLAEEKHQDMKLRYYQLMIRYWKKKSNYLEACKAYRAIFDTPKIQADPELWKQALSNAAIFLLLAPFDSEYSDLLYRVKAEKKLAELPSVKVAYDLFTTDELTSWPLPFEAEWKEHPVFSEEEGKDRWEVLHKRVVQHNIRVMSQYYSRITTPRLAQLLQLDEQAAEANLSEMVSSRQLSAKIDRPAKIVVFSKKHDANDLLNDWAFDVSKLLNLVGETCHMINKENMIHQIAANN
eukprot:TRINITY_DN17198_c0_g1_i1.p1 TRINITY_DN17198_c0_g1~~TRINITY_DN17198_c0_g1_i1.p1  ORF type:complete len:469 (+),score=156.49 TRINITY_DN17198_c0_g1_i1:77-1408(+)